MNNLTNIHTRTLLRVLGTCVALSLGTPSHAQFGGGMGGMGGMPRGPGGEPARGMRPERPTQPPRQAMTERLYQVRMRLLIAPDQAPAWDRFHAAMVALVAEDSHAVAMSDRVSALRTMQLQLSRVQNQYAKAEEAADALKALYEVLTPSQRESGDQVLPALITETLAFVGKPGPLAPGE